jgi:DNA-binding transcriptional MerR regulator
MLTIKALSKLAGITPRTLHYYDQIGLLKPSAVGENGYRYYDDAAPLHLQQIMLYRELEKSLESIRKIMGRSDFDAITALENHEAALLQRMARLERLMILVEDTIQYLKGNKTMSKAQLFEVFNEEQQAEYEQEAMQMYDPAIVKESNRKWKNYSVVEKQRIGEEGNAAYQAILDAMPKGPASPEAQAGVERWRKHMDYFWTPNPEQLMGLAEMYSADPRFKANFDKIDPRLAEFMLEAVNVYVERMSKK